MVDRLNQLVENWLADQKACLNPSPLGLVLACTVSQAISEILVGS